MGTAASFVTASAAVGGRVRTSLSSLGLGLCHGVGDASAGFVLATLVRAAPIASWAPLVLTYNLAAFGLQVVIAPFIDRWRLARAAALASPALAGIAVLVSRIWPIDGAVAAALIAGLASALLHVGAGALALERGGGRAAGLGFFTAPGVIGLAIGGAGAEQGDLALLALLACLLINGVLIVSVEPLAPRSSPSSHSNRSVLWVGLALLLVCIGLRSFAWAVSQAGVRGVAALVWPTALAAGFGKALGGWAADRIGWRTWIVAALVAGAAFIGLGGRYAIGFVIGVAALQSALPAAIAACASRLPGRPALTMALTLGLCVACGGLPQWMGLISTRDAAIWVAAGALLAGLAGGLALRQPKGQAHAQA